MGDELVAALRPHLDGYALIVEVLEMGDGRVYRNRPELHRALSTCRGVITRDAKYSNPRNTAKFHYATYSWDAEAEGWKLEDYVPQGTPIADFPWKKK